MLSKKKTIPVIPERQCGDCKACCEGWLHADIYGEKMYSGRPCHFICETGCSIYKDRPIEPCVSYKCLWLKENKIPGWMKPNKCGVILSEKTIKKISYIEAVEAGKKFDSSVLSWLFMLHINHHVNIYYIISGSSHMIGSKEFLEAFK